MDASLFFIPDIPCAIAEMHRVLRPGGALLAVTMAEAYTDELRVALCAAAEELEVTRQPNWLNLHQRFNLTNGLLFLEPHFHVVQFQHESVLVFPNVEPVLAYVNSMRDTLERDLSNRTWDEFIAALRKVVSAEIAAQGEFRVSKPAGVLIAVKRTTDR